jgi:hypothetical protein
METAHTFEVAVVECNTNAVQAGGLEELGVLILEEVFEELQGIGSDVRYEY